MRPADPGKDPFRPGKAPEPQRLYIQYEQQIHQTPQRGALELTRPRRDDRRFIRRRRVYVGEQARNVARGGRPQIGTGDEKVPNLFGSKRKSGPVQQNQAGVEAIIIQQPEFNHGRVEFCIRFSFVIILLSLIK